MSERDALLTAVCTNPEDDTPRLVFADWLDEHDEVVRAEFIRLQIELEGLPDGKKKQKLQAREKTLLDKYGDAWSESLKPYFAYYYRGTYAYHYAPPVVFRRGFVETIAMDVNTFLDRGYEVFALAPIRGLRIQDAQSLDNLAGCEDLLRLHALNLHGAVLSEDGSGASGLFRSKYLANLTTLIARGFDDNGHLDVAGLRTIANARYLKKLERLDVSDNWMFSRPVREQTAFRKLIWKLGEKMPALRELRLSGIGMRCGELSAMTAQPWVTRLRVLDLSRNQLAEHGCRALCESKHLADLERLVLTRNDRYDAATDSLVPLPTAVRKMLTKRFGKKVEL